MVPCVYVQKETKHLITVTLLKKLQANYSLSSMQTKQLETVHCRVIKTNATSYVRIWHLVKRKGLQLTN